MPHGSPDFLTPIVPVNISIEPGEPPVINVEDSPVAETWGWDKDSDIWRKILVNSDGKLIIDPSEIFENVPTDNEHGKGPDSDWAHDHKEDANAHHTPTPPGVTVHNDLTGIGPNDHHTPTVAVDLNHNDLSNIGSSDHHAPTVAVDLNHNDLANIGSNDHHSPTVAEDLNHNDLSNIGSSDHHIKTTLHTDITDFHPAVQDTLSCRGSLVEKAPQLGSNTQIMELVVFNSKLYCIALSDGALYEWNGTDAWVSKAPRPDTENGGYCLCLHNSKLYMGSANNANLYEWNGTDAWVKKADGIGTATIIFCLASYGGKLYAGVNNDGALWEWNGTDTWVSKASKYSSEVTIRKLLVFNSKLYGGTNPQGYLLEWNDSDAWVLKSGTSNVQNDIESMCVHNSKLYVGSNNTGKLYEWNSTDTLTEVAPQYLSQTYIDSLISFEDRLYGGSYGSAYLLVWNGSDSWGVASVCDDVETSIRSLCIFNSKLYCGTQVLGKLFVLDQLTLCEFQADPDFHPPEIHKTSLITSGIFNRDRLSAAANSVFFIPRGSVDSYDFQIGDFTFNNTVQSLDLSSIVPSNSKLVLLGIKCRSTSASDFCVIYHPDYTIYRNEFVVYSQVANVPNYGAAIVECNSSRVVYYRSNPGDWDRFDLTVRGWWL